MESTTSEAITPIPSKLKPHEGRHDEIQNRIAIIKANALKNELPIPEQFGNDEHYWFIATERYHKVHSVLRNDYQDKETLKKRALQLALDEAKEIVNREREAATDGLTGLWGRKALDNFINNLRARPREDRETGLMLVDIDNFSEINNLQGHTKGDQMLREMAALMTDYSRGPDMVARYGGEEFCLVLPDLPTGSIEDVTASRADSLRKIIEQQMGITVSIGTTIIKPEDITTDDTYNRADANLYKAKHDGKNAVYSDKERVSPATIR